MKTAVDTSSETYRANRERMLERIADLAEQHRLAVGAGGERNIERHHRRGKLTARERIELLVDEDSPFLELSPLAAWGTDFAVGASVVTGLGVVEGVECLVVANDPTVKGGSSNPSTLRKVQRAGQIGRASCRERVSLSV